MPEDTPKRKLSLKRMIKAPIESVWEAWSVPEHIVKWWGPNGHTNTIQKMDFREGGEWRLTMQGPDGKKYPNRSTFLEIIPLKKIAFEHFNPHFLATVFFESIGDDTQIEWISLFDSQKDFQIIVKTFRADEGQKQNLDKLEIYLSDLNRK